MKSNLGIFFALLTNTVNSLELDTLNSQVVVYLNDSIKPNMTIHFTWFFQQDPSQPLTNETPNTDSMDAQEKSEITAEKPEMESSNAGHSEDKPVRIRGGNTYAVTKSKKKSRKKAEKKKKKHSKSASRIYKHPLPPPTYPINR
jgi:hypothetical protein